jgi:hypothetical protein
MYIFDPVDQQSQHITNSLPYGPDCLLAGLDLKAIKTKIFISDIFSCISFVYICSEVFLNHFKEKLSGAMQFRRIDRGRRDTEPRQHTNPTAIIRSSRSDS